MSAEEGVLFRRQDVSVYFTRVAGAVEEEWNVPDGPAHGEEKGRTQRGMTGLQSGQREAPPAEFFADWSVQRHQDDHDKVERN